MCTVRVLSANDGNSTFLLERREKKHRKRLISLLLFMLCECVRLIKNDEAKATAKDMENAEAQRRVKIQHFEY